MIYVQTAEDVRNLIGETGTYRKHASVQAVQVNEAVTVETTVKGEIEAVFTAYPGDYLCVGIEGEVWRVEKEIFEKTYKPVREAAYPERPDVVVHSAVYDYDKFFKIVAVDYEYRLEDGTWFNPTEHHPHLVFERGDAAAVLVHNLDTDTVELVRQFRIPTYGWITELPAGMVAKHELPAECAAREVEEELGYAVTHIDLISKFYVSPGGTSERIFVYYTSVTEADRKSAGGGLKYEGEHIERVSLPVSNIRHMLNRGHIQDAKTIIALEWVLSNKI